MVVLVFGGLPSFAVVGPRLSLSFGGCPIVLFGLALESFRMVAVKVDFGNQQHSMFAG